MPFNYLIDFFVFLFGLCIGSFLNCFIYRLEEGKTLAGRSFCPRCKHALFWYDLFPVFSYLFLLGRCRYCHKKISVQYPAVELATGIIFLLIFSAKGGPASGWKFLNLAFLFYIASSLIIIFIYDLKHFIIPDKVLFPAIIATLIFNFSLYSILAAIIASGFFFVIWFVSRGKWMGFGDVKLAVLMGLLLGMPNVLLALFLAFFFGAIIGVILMIFGGKSAGWRMKSEIPFGPFLILGTFIALLYGSQIIQWYLNILKI